MRAWLRWLAGDVAPAAAVLLLLVPASSWILLRQWRMPVDTAETCRAKALENAAADVAKWAGSEEDRAQARWLAEARARYQRVHREGCRLDAPTDGGVR